MAELMQLLVQCVGAGVVLGLICSVMSLSAYHIGRYLRAVFTP